LLTTFHKNPEKILIVKPSALGDIVHSLPFLASIRKRFPNSEIHWVIARGFHQLLEDHPMISRLWIIDKDQWKKLSNAVETLTTLRKLSRNLRDEKFDLVVDLQGLFRSGLICWATRAKYRIGFAEGREGSPFFYTHSVCGGRDIHAIERYMKIASFLGCDTRALLYPFAPPGSGSMILHSLPQDYVVIAPSAGGESKKWPAERFGEVASRLPWKSAVIASKADAEVADQVVGASKGMAFSLAGRTNLRELIPLISGARFFLSCDTGPMHIAAALNVPVFALFGPTNPKRTGPYGPGHTIIRQDLPCSPCYKRKKCKDGSCLDAISVDRVLSSIEEKLGLSSTAVSPVAVMCR
jgi:heptosyltransferase I